MFDVDAVGIAKHHTLKIFGDIIYPIYSFLRNILKHSIPGVVNEIIRNVQSGQFSDIFPEEFFRDFSNFKISENLIGMMVGKQLWCHFFFKEGGKFAESCVNIQVNDHSTQIKDDIFYFVGIQFWNIVWNFVGKYLILHSQIQGTYD